MEADCRNCKNFVSRNSIQFIHLRYRYPDVLDQIKEAKKNNEEYLGYCLAWNRLVFYYTGHCRRYNPRFKSKGEDLRRFM